MNPSPVQVQARALGDPTRYEVYRYVADAAGSVDVAELTRHFGLNHNAIRHHLSRLVDAGLLEESTAPSTGRGRPRLLYRAAAAAGSGWGALGPYERLSVLLAQALRTGASPVEVGRQAVAGTVEPAGADVDPVDVVVDAMARHGFDPVVRRRGRRVELLLRACPFEAAALADPEVICAVHRGMADGVTELADGRITVDELVPRDPRRHACRLHLHRDDHTDLVPGGAA